jgi:hypothetical protein
MNLKDRTVTLKNNFCSVRIYLQKSSIIILYDRLSFHNKFILLLPHKDHQYTDFNQS